MPGNHATFRRRLLKSSAPLATFIAMISAGAMAHAQDSAATPRSSDTLAEVVVTAQFREQNLQATPLAITAVNSVMLEQRSQTDISQVAAQAPNVTLTAAGGQGSASMVAFIRGVGQTDFNFALEPGVGVYVDDVYYATLAGSLLDLLDLDRVEILRGPQGTLAGKNSIGGAIKLFSKKPNGDNGGFLEGTYGRYNRIDFRGAADFTIVPDKLFARISGVSKNRDGYVTRKDYACTHPGSGLPTFATGPSCKLGTLGGQSMNALRLALRWVPSERVEVNIAADATNDKSEAVANTLLYVVPGKSGLSLNGVPYDNRFVPFGPNSADPNRPNDRFLSYASFLDASVGRFRDPVSGNDRNPYKPLAVPPVNHFKTWGVSGVVDIDLGNKMNLKSVSSYRKYSNDFAENTDGSPIGVQMLLQRLEHHQWSQELRLNGSVLDDALDYTVGGFWLKQDGTLEARVDLPWVPGLGNLPGFVQQTICGSTSCQGPLDFNHGPDTTPSNTKAAFAQVTYKLTEQLSVTGGTRYSLENKTYTYLRHNPDGTLPQACVGNFSPLDPPNCSLFGLNGTSARFPGPTGDEKRWDWRADVNYRFTPDLMVYAQFATGYKGGGVNPRPFFVSQELPFGPETLTAYEIGFKTQWYDRRIRLNGAAFFNNYKDIQLTLSQCDNVSPFPGAPCSLPANVGAAHVKGFELETEAHPIPGLEFDGSVSYLDFEYTSVNPLAGVTLDMTTPYTPKWKWSLGVQYEIPLGTFGSLTPRLDAAYQSTIFTSAINCGPAVVSGCPVADSNRIGGYTTLNGRVTLRSGPWSAAVEVTNLTNKKYYTVLFDQTSGPGYLSGTPAMPRRWAVTLRRTF